MRWIRPLMDAEARTVPRKNSCVNRCCCFCCCCCCCYHCCWCSRFKVCISPLRLTSSFGFKKCWWPLNVVQFFLRKKRENILFLNLLSFFLPRIIFLAELGVMAFWSPIKTKSAAVYVPPCVKEPLSACLDKQAFSLNVQRPFLSDTFYVSFVVCTLAVS